MILAQFPISRSFFNKLKGKVKIPEEYSYEVFGPFGTGFNIKVSRNNTFGKLMYSRDATWGCASTELGDYEIHVKGIATKKERILEVSDHGSFVPINDKAAMALFIVYSHYWNKTGPFLR